jgi:3-oxoacyl-[acyl-carrier protein] reductase
MTRLAGLAAVVTGGGSGIGAATARAFHAEGARVAVLDRDAAAAAETASDLDPIMSTAIAVEVDIADSVAVDAAIARVVAAFGTVDVLANFAGIDDPDAKARTATRRAAGEPLDITATMTNEAWRRMMSVNLDGSFYMLRAALRVMSAQRSGSIINMSSLAGVIGAAGSPHYSAAKAALIGLTQSVAREVAPLGIRVNAVAPGPVITPMLSRTTSASTSAIPPVPMQRFADPGEVATVAVFLASSDSSYVTGDVIHIDGSLRAV